MSSVFFIIFVYESPKFEGVPQFSVSAVVTKEELAVECRPSSSTPKVESCCSPDGSTGHCGAESRKRTSVTKGICTWRFPWRSSEIGSNEATQTCGKSSQPSTANKNVSIGVARHHEAERQIRRVPSARTDRTPSQRPFLCGFACDSPSRSGTLSPKAPSFP